MKIKGVRMDEAGSVQRVDLPGDLMAVEFESENGTVVSVPLSRLSERLIVRAAEGQLVVYPRFANEVEVQVKAED